MLKYRGFTMILYYVKIIYYLIDGLYDGIRYIIIL